MNMTSIMMLRGEQAEICYNGAHREVECAAYSPVGLADGTRK